MQRQTLWPISTIPRSLCTRLLCISVSNFTSFASQDTELLLRNRTSVIYPEIFHAPCRKTYALDWKMMDAFLMFLTSSITVQSLCEIELYMLAVGVKIRCCVFLFLSCHSPVCRCVVRGSHILNRYCGTICVSMLNIFNIFPEGIALSDTL